MEIIDPFTYIGPNRRSDKTVIEWGLKMTSTELNMVNRDKPGSLKAIQHTLQKLGCKIYPEFSEPQKDPGAMLISTLTAVAHWIARMALVFQQNSGHKVFFDTVLAKKSSEQSRLVFEYEHLETGLDAGELAMRVLAESIPGLTCESQLVFAGMSLEEACKTFLSEAAKYCLPLDTQAIIDAAVRLDVPSVKLERDPYGALEGEFRIRRNGLLKLGHSRHQHIVDGTLCVDRNASLVPVLFDREKMVQCMLHLGLPTARQYPGFLNDISMIRERIISERFSFPVMLKPVRRSLCGESPFGRSGIALSSNEELKQAIEKMSSDGQAMMVEQYIAGSVFHLVLAANELICILDDSGQTLLPSDFYSSTLDLALRTSSVLNCGLLRIKLVTTEPGRPLAETGGAFISIDPAPCLDQLFAKQPQLIDTAAEHFMRWMFPPGKRSRIPLVAVTGTNGKTSTSRMISCIMQKAGYSPGMASTNGIYINGVLQKVGDLAGGEGHHDLLESREIDFGVLETARGAVAHSGFMFDWCDVAVCLNVSRDHIGELEVDSLKAMIGIKRSVMERARRAVVLNADYASTVSMLPFDHSLDIYLVSLTANVSAVRELSDKPSFVCVLEEEGGDEWIMLYDPDGVRIPVIRVNSIPATFDGQARFNVSNAQHAICASRASGAKFDAIRAGLAGFEPSVENNPGRLNIFTKLPFKVILDYAHNTDGFQKLSSFVDTQVVSGRKIVVFGINPRQRDADIKAGMAELAGHYDHYFCVKAEQIEGREGNEIIDLLSSGLISAGVSEDQISLVFADEKWWQAGLDMAAPGDLLLVIPDFTEVQQIWGQLESMASEHAVQSK